MAPSSMKPSTVSFASTQALVSMVPISSPGENGGPCRARRRARVSEVERDPQSDRLKVAVAPVEVNGAVRVLRGQLEVAPREPVEGGGPDALAPAAHRSVAEVRRAVAAGEFQRAEAARSEVQRLLRDVGAGPDAGAGVAPPPRAEQ